MPNMIWVIKHGITGELWGPDGWVNPPADVMIYDDYDEVVRDSVRIKGIIMEYRLEAKTCE